MSENIPEYKNQDSSRKMTDVAKNYAVLKSLIHGAVPPNPASKLIKMLDALAPDLTHDDGLLLGFVNAPAAKRNHHAYRGGLVVHLIEMWHIWQTRFREDFPFSDHVNDLDAAEEREQKQSVV